MSPSSKACPECSGKSKIVHRENYWGDRIEIVRACKECPTEFVVAYGDPVVVESTTADGESKWLCRRHGREWLGDNNE